jgi:hypothetical protein
MVSDAAAFFCDGSAGVAASDFALLGAGVALVSAAGDEEVSLKVEGACMFVEELSSGEAAGLAFSSWECADAMRPNTAAAKSGKIFLMGTDRMGVRRKRSRFVNKKIVGHGVTTVCLAE